MHRVFMNMKMSCTTSLLQLACLFLTATSQEANTAVEQLSSAEIATKLLQHGAPRALIDHVLDAALDGTQVSSVFIAAPVAPAAFGAVVYYVCWSRRSHRTPLWRVV